MYIAPIAILVVLAVFVISSACWAATYYVDATNGNDNNDGLSASTTWKTLTKVNSSKFKAGDSILFKKGETWRGQLLPHSGAPGNPVTYGSYGTGNLPLLLGSVSKNNTNYWTHEGGNIWSTKIAENLDVGNLILDYENSVGIKVSNEEYLSKQGEFWHDGGNSVLKIYSKSNPASYYNGSIECALRRHIISIVNKSYINIEKLHLRYTGAHGIAAFNVSNIEIRDCSISYIGGSYLAGTTRYGNGIEFGGDSSNALVKRCRLWEIYDAAITAQGNKVNKKSNIHFHYNLIWNCEWSFELWQRPAEATLRNVHFENNTCLNAGGGWGHNQRPDPSGRHLSFLANEANTDDIYIRNNIFYEATENAIMIHTPWKGLDNLILDYNCWYQSSGILINYQWDIYTIDQFSTYQTEKGKDANSILSVPSFKDAENHDFRLSHNSACIDAGTDVGLSQDYDGTLVPQGSEVDIGAFEYKEDTNPPTPPTGLIIQ